MTDDESTDVELESVDYSEIGEKPMEVYETISDQLNVPVTMIIDNLEDRWGVDPADMTEDQAEELLEAGEKGDAEQAGEVLEDMGVPENVREQVEESFRAIDRGEIDPSDLDSEDAAVDDDESPSTNPDNGKTQAGVSRAEVQQMVQQQVEQSMPDAGQIASELESRMSQGQQQQGGMDPQQEMALQLAKNFLAPDQPANPGAEQMAQAQNQMMEGFGSIMQGIAEGISDNMKISFEGDASPKKSDDDADDADDDE